MLVTTGVAASLLIVRNRNRKSLIFQNTDSADTVYVKRERAATPTVSATDFDFKLSPGAAVGLNSLLDGSEAIQDSYSVIAAANTPVVAVFETEDIIR
jgi:hypothetical protein